VPGRSSAPAPAQTRPKLDLDALLAERADLRAQLDAARAPPTPPPEPLTLEVTLNARDAAVILALAEDDYRSPSQQVGWIVAQWLKLHATTLRAPASSPAPSSNGHSSPPAPVSSPPHGAPQPPAGLIPVYHIGDGSAGSGCGRVGLFFQRPIGEGDTIGPGDVVRLDGSPLTTGGLVCGHCGGPLTMGPRNWRAGSEED
jgi:hypothetical protein